MFGSKQPIQTRSVERSCFSTCEKDVFLVLKISNGTSQTFFFRCVSDQILILFLQIYVAVFLVPFGNLGFEVGKINLNGKFELCWRITRCFASNQMGDIILTDGSYQMYDFYYFHFAIKVFEEGGLKKALCLNMQIYNQRYFLVKQFVNLLV